MEYNAPIEPTLSARVSRVKLAIWLTAASVGLYWISLYLYVPSLPVFAQTKTTDLAQVGVILAQYGLWQAVVRLPLGILSDWMGRRAIWIHVGFLLAGAGALLMGRAAGYEGLVIGRAITGLAAGSWVVMVVAFSGLFTPQEAVRATAMLTLVNSVSRMFATGMNGVLNEWGGYGLAFTLSAVVAGAAVLVYLPVREIPRSPQKPSLASTGSLVIRPDVLLPALLNAVLQYAAYATTFGFVPILAKQLGAREIALGLLVSFNIGVVMLGNLVSTTFIRRVGAISLVYAGFILTTIGILSAGQAGSISFVFMSQFIIGLGNGIAYPVLMGLSIEKVEENRRSTAMGLHQAVYAIGMFAGPWLSGILADRMGIQPMFTMTSVAILVVSIGLTVLLGKARGVYL